MGTCFSSSSSSSRRDVDIVDRYYGTRQYKVSMQRDKNTRDKYDSSRKFDVSSIFSDENDDYYSPRRSFDVCSISSDESYASAKEELQESLFSSSPASTVEMNHQPEKESTTWIKDLLATWINRFKPKTRTTKLQEVETEIKPAKTSGGFFCMICMEEKPSSEIFKGTITCTHSYCTECTIRYVTTKIEENVASIKCPDMECTQLIHLYTCRDLITNDMFERWDKKLRDTLILSWKQLECPFKDCSTVMVVDDENARKTVTECPSCHRLFCAQCKVKWHAGIGCEEFERRRSKVKSSDHEDTLLVKMVERNKWRRCPSCKFYVEKVDGCMSIHCRCGLTFCYGCGSAEFDHECWRERFI